MTGRQLTRRQSTGTPAPRALALTTAAALLAVLGAAPPAVAAPVHPWHPRRHAPDTDKQNWAGYEALGKTDEFKHVEARWRQPAVECTPGIATYAAFWVGLDGARKEEGDNTVEQTGTGAWCGPTGRTEYYAWYEMWPQDLIEYNDPIRPGDDLQAEVRALSHERFELVLRDFTQKWNEITYATVRPRDEALLNCAEVIAEAPGPSSTRLADFGRVRFTDSLANGRPIGELDRRAVTMATEKPRTVRAQPSVLSADGRDFTVTWRSN
ncbi:G1 family glutamic endopeptidase [Kitasatospora viridis]|uniref:Peptidase A4-like protein n=1 Tax=Kitasatospora viridis TaxID=281105 RepID=A0A561T6Q2_9ACTN|nr:G1 family glutamic endopeptidase [Kitasatospora viridis]TWF82794.1 peptidase A4-like protein [Kitasatospora viridis]